MQLPMVKVSNETEETRIRSVEHGICPIAALCTVLFYCPDVKP